MERILEKVGKVHARQKAVNLLTLKTVPGRGTSCSVSYLAFVLHLSLTPSLPLSRCPSVFLGYSLPRRP